MKYYEHLHEINENWHLHCQICGEIQKDVNKNMLTFISCGFNSVTIYEDKNKCKFCERRDNE